jgi:DNA repair exonuclease SbcCD ATPase subunit
VRILHTADWHLGRQFHGVSLDEDHESVLWQVLADTIFIDEGFGSLDTENDGGTLDRVLQVLQEIVGRNRAVGLISHVSLVQQAVPNGFSIVKGIGGSRVERRAM